MNMQPDAETQPAILPILLSMLGTRMELAATDAEAHLQAVFTSLMTAFAAVVLGLIGFAFVGIAVIVFFWETHRVSAAVGVMLGYVALATALAFHARSRWRTRPSAFAATLRELALDAEAFRGRL